MDTAKSYLSSVWEIFLEMSPYLLLGFFLAGLLHVFMPKKFMKKHLGQPKFSSIFKAAMLGIPLPLCSCGVIPTGVSLQQNGASKGATNSYLISTPQTGVDSILITYSLMNIYWAIARPIIALVTALFGGWLTDKFVEHEPHEISELDVKNTDEKKSFGSQFKRIFSYAFIDFLADISRPLVLGVLMAALITTITPTSLFSSYLTEPLINMVIILIVSVPIYICATASVPLAAALLLVGVSPGAVLVFLMAGPATNAATITVLWKSLGRRTTIIYLASIIIGAFTFGIIIDYILPANLFIINNVEANHVHDTQNWLAISASIALIILILFVEIKKLIPTQMKMEQHEKAYLIEGMDCNHCKASVEKNVGQINGIISAKVDLANKTLVVDGQVEASTIAKTVNDLG